MILCTTALEYNMLTTFLELGKENKKEEKNIS